MVCPSQISEPVVFLGLSAHRYAAATQWSAPVCPGGGSADLAHIPLMITVCSRNGSSGSKTMEYLKSLSPAARFGSPGPPASGTHHPGAAPWGTKMPVKRVFGFAAVLLSKVCAGIMESSNGNASATPAPRRSVRREMCFLVMNIDCVPYLSTRNKSASSRSRLGGRCPERALAIRGDLLLLIHLERLALP